MIQYIHIVCDWCMTDLTKVSSFEGTKGTLVKANKVELRRLITGDISCATINSACNLASCCCNEAFWNSSSEQRRASDDINYKLITI